MTRPLELSQGKRPFIFSSTTHRTSCIPLSVVGTNVNMCYFNNDISEIEDYDEPYDDDEGMSTDEEDYLDYLLGGEGNDEEDCDQLWQPTVPYL